MFLTNNITDRFSKFGLAGLFLYFLISAFITIPQVWDFALPTICVGVMSLGYFLTQSKMNAWRKKRENLIKGSWEDYIVCPSPSSSMMNTVLKKNVRPQEITELYFQTYELKNNYFERQLKNNLKELGILDQVRLEFVGFGTESDAIKIKEIFPTAVVSFSENRLSEHVNLIKLKNDDLYVWYEPVHKADGENDKIYRPVDGAFLIKSTDPKGAFEYYNSVKHH